MESVVEPLGKSLQEKINAYEILFGKPNTKMVDKYVLYFPLQRFLLSFFQQHVSCIQRYHESEQLWVCTKLVLFFLVVVVVVISVINQRSREYFAHIGYPQQSQEQITSWLRRSVENSERKVR